MNALHAFRALVGAGCRFEVVTNDDGDTVLGIHGELTPRLQRLVERDPEGLAAVVAEQLEEMVPDPASGIPSMVHFVRAKDGLVARWRTTGGKVQVSEVNDPDKKKRGKHGED